VTSGDRWSAAGGPPPDKGLFVKELEVALLEGRADLAVHSAKDLPAERVPGLAVLAVPPRADPRDVLVPGPLDALPHGARVATGSPRRAAQLLAARPDLEVVPIRGNVDTRLRKLGDGAADALVLAAAGLARLGLTPPGAAALPVGVCTPAPGQGLLAIEGRVGDPAATEAAAVLDNGLAHACLTAERALLAGMGGGCMTPVGALCEPDGDALRLVAFSGSPDGRRVQRAEVHGSRAHPEDLGRRGAAALEAVPA
jgi:hydroxymethylbilane synthase